MANSGYGAAYDRPEAIGGLPTNCYNAWPLQPESEELDAASSGPTGEPRLRVGSVAMFDSGELPMTRHGRVSILPTSRETQAWLTHGVPGVSATDPDALPSTCFPQDQG